MFPCPSRVESEQTHTDCVTQPIRERAYPLTGNFTLFSADVPLPRTA